MDHCLFCWEVALLLHSLCYKDSGGHIHCNGHVWTEPAPVLLMGSDISIFCTSTKQRCSRGSFFFFVNDILSTASVNRINDTTVQLQLPNFRIPDCNVICKVACDGKSKDLVCGMTLLVGYPPDSPTNFTCVSHERSVRMACTWKTGKHTYIETNYTVHLESSQANEEQLFLANNNSTIAVNKLQEDTEYSVWIQAENALGTAKSDLLQFHLHDIVIPAAPSITRIESINNSASHTIVHWEKQTSIKNVYCELRYRATNRHAWKVVKGDDTSSSNALQKRCTLEPYTEYEFQAHCRHQFGRKYWSEWSASFKHTTPESEPLEMLDVWRFFGQAYTNGSQEIIVLIKPFAPEVARGRILEYRIFYGDQEHKRNSKICKTSELQCRIVVPQTVHTISVIAYNSQGSSKPAHLTVQHEYDSKIELLSPRNMQVISALQDGILVKWQSLERSVLWYIVEWVSEPCDKQEHDFSWKKVPKSHTSTYIQEHIKPGRPVNISLYAIYPNGTSKPCTDFGFSMEDKPIKGPTILQQRRVGNKVYIEWEDIPVCEQKGFITNYTIYLRNETDGSCKHYVVDSSKKQWKFENLNPGIIYAAYITASTATGEGPPGAEIEITLNPIVSASKNVKVLLAVGLAAPVLIFLLVLVSNGTICKRIKTIFLSWAPKWLLEDFPNVKNSTAITLLKAKNELVPLHSIPLVLNDDDPVITEVQEALLQEEQKSSNTEEDQKNVIGKNLDNSQNAFFVDSASIIDLPKQVDGYKPQISARNPMKSLAPESDGTLPEISDTMGNVACLENVFLRNDTSPLSLLWNIESGGNTVNFNETNLVLNNSEKEPAEPLSLTRAEKYIPLEYKWKAQFSVDTVQEQTLLPDELVGCFTPGHEESPDSKAYFTQEVWNVFQ
ncbi:interleukin-23 receptor isoform X2 [Rhinatrema bivittatum]|uniref:interleukin-23 receptor isoform X2 n=1 Tax=Rhinatrema bivittatum TaxID=194408 RepID=UPI00112A9DB4|nr:interleukin-23 receptor isoform X2 [Rhinatrema bivittatum]